MESPGRRCRERRVTPRLATLCCLVLWIAACGGGGPKKETYKKAVSEQETCCNQLADASARDQCKGNIVRVDDPEVQASDANLATYACVEKYFICDPTTGTATKESAQSQLDCINDL